ncbi:MAG: hypothetical protein A3F72_00100 [Bacteroidetes bacterium RIFCSPLOWO2_12_FULL_35_15]|nr:MAG: hypothetical protein A3F72_00100 [Bacteroidetes bacterium RIFCSPLOWO2_12_FULL_35_15]
MKYYKKKKNNNSSHLQLRKVFYCEVKRNITIIHLPIFVLTIIMNFTAEQKHRLGYTFFRFFQHTRVSE